MSGVGDPWEYFSSWGETLTSVAAVATKTVADQLQNVWVSFSCSFLFFSFLLNSFVFAFCTFNSYLFFQVDLEDVKSGVAATTEKGWGFAMDVWNTVRVFFFFSLCLVF